jgi:DNA polymerase delta subunit 1
MADDDTVGTDSDREEYEPDAEEDPVVDVVEEEPEPDLIEVEEPQMPLKRLRLEEKPQPLQPIVDPIHDFSWIRAQGETELRPIMEFQVNDIEILMAPQMLDYEPKDILGFRAQHDDNDDDFGNQRKRHSTYAPMVPMVKLYGRTEQGVSICADIYGFYPTVQVGATMGLDPNRPSYVAAEIVEVIERRLQAKEQYQSNKRLAIVSYRVVKGFPLYPYTNESSYFLELTLGSPYLVRKFGELLDAENGALIATKAGDISCWPYGVIDALSQFQSKYEVYGCGWVKMRSARSYRSEEGLETNKARTQMECMANITDIQAMPDKDTVAPLRVLSIDIECASNQGFPTPETDPVILIGCVALTWTPEKEKQQRIILQWGSANPVEGLNDDEAHVCTQTEEGLFRDLEALIDAFDPDAYLGHNIMDFDIPYIVCRANNLYVSPRTLGRRKGIKWREPRTIEKKRKSGASKKYKYADTPGVWQIDTLPWFTENSLIKERSYRLGALAAKFLNDTKEDVGYRMITPMWQGTDITRSRLAKYCLKDAVLALQLALKVDFAILMETVEMSRTTHLVPTRLLHCGMREKVYSLIYSKIRTPGWGGNLEAYIPCRRYVQKSKDDVKYEGATVLEPRRGFYLHVGVADYNSLYPSMMRFHNICYSTIIHEKKLQDTIPNQESPSHSHFVTREIRRGVLPQIQDELAAKRSMAKKLMGEAKAQKNWPKGAQYNQRQLSIKLASNSIYGVLGSEFDFLGTSVTTWGKTMIATAKRIAEAPPFNGKVLAGDTDSVMVQFPNCHNVAETKEQLEKMCVAINVVFQSPVSQGYKSPVNIEAEKVYAPYLVMKKKHYIGYKYEGTAEPKLDCKGIEIARRDNCEFVVKTMKKIVNQLFCTAANTPTEIANRITAIKGIVKDALSDLYLGRVKIADLVVSKAISKSEYKNPQIHMEVAKKMHERDPSYVVRPQDRIPFVILCNANKKAKVYERADDPLYAIMNGLPIDVEYYRTKQLMKPVSKLMGWPMATKAIKAKIEPVEAELRIKDGIATEPGSTKEAKLEYVAQKKLFDKLLEKEVIGNAQKILFGDDVLRTVDRKKSRSGNKGIAGFTCQRCHKNLGIPLCTACKNGTFVIDPSQQAEIEELDKKIAKCKAKCTKCRGYEDTSGEIKCVQRDCRHLLKMATLTTKRADIAPKI